MFRGRRLGDRECLASEEGERDLARRRIVGRGDLGEHASSLRTLVGKAPVAERAVGDDRRIVTFAPRDDFMLDRPFLEMVEDLVAGDLARTGEIKRLIEIGNVEVADAPGEDLA
jgi:hypothetical protein